MERTESGTVSFLSHENPPFLELLYATYGRVGSLYPQVKIEFAMHPGVSSEEAVLQGLVDVAFAAHIGSARFPDESREGLFEFAELSAFPDVLSFAIPLGHSLLEKAEVSFSDIMREHVSVPEYDDHTFLLEAFKKFCEREGFVPQFEYFSASNQAEIYLTPFLSGIHLMTQTYLKTLPYREMALSKMRLVTPCDKDCSTRAFAFWRKDSKNGALKYVVEQMLIANDALAKRAG